jgi:hypothetical protein
LQKKQQELRRQAQDDILMKKKFGLLNLEEEEHFEREPEVQV